MTSMPRARRPFAASSPSSPPPITTARRCRAAAPIMSPRVGDIAVGAARPAAPTPGNRQHDRFEPVASSRRSYGASVPSCGDHETAPAVDAGDALSQVQPDAVRSGTQSRPFSMISARLRLPRQHRREQDAVVVGMRLGAEHRDVVALGREPRAVLPASSPRPCRCRPPPAAGGARGGSDQAARGMRSSALAAAEARRTTSPITTMAGLASPAATTAQRQASERRDDLALPGERRVLDRARRQVGGKAGGEHVGDEIDASRAMPM